MSEMKNYAATDAQMIAVLTLFANVVDFIDVRLVDLEQKTAQEKLNLSGDLRSIFAAMPFHLSAFDKLGQDENSDYLVELTYIGMMFGVLEEWQTNPDVMSLMNYQPEN